MPSCLSHSLVTAKPLLASHVPKISSIFQEAQENSLLGRNHQNSFGSQIQRQTVRQTAKDRRETG